MFDKIHVVFLTVRVMMNCYTIHLNKRRLWRNPVGLSTSLLGTQSFEMGALNECMYGWMGGWIDWKRKEWGPHSNPISKYPVFSLTEILWAVVPVSPVSPVQWGP